MTASVAKIEQFLQEANYKYRQLNENYLLLLFQGQNVDTLPVYIRCSETFVVLYTPLMAPPHTNRRQLYERLLELSFSIYFAKCSLDPAGTPLLQIQWPTADLDREEFFLALNGLVTYADRHYRELQEIGRSRPDKPESLPDVPAVQGGDQELSE